MPPEETATIEIDPSTEFDPLALDPRNLVMPGDPPKEPEPVTPPAPDPAKPEPDPVTPTPTDTKPEPKNFKELKALRAQAEADRDKYLAERDALAKKVADLEPRTTTFEQREKQLQEELNTLKTKHDEQVAALRRSSARETPEWKEKADAIRTAAKAVDEILGLEAVKEAGLTHSLETLLHPASRNQLNETVKVLQESGHYAEAQDLLEAHRSVNVWRTDLRKIEEAAQEEAKSWQANREGKLSQTFRAVRDHLGRENPLHDTRSAEFLALPKEQQEWLLAQHKEAEVAAQKILDDPPERLAASAYQNALALRLSQQALRGTSERLKTLEAELADHKQKLAAYEKAAGGGASGGAGGGSLDSLPDDANELIKALEPRNMPGYKGVGL